MVVKENFEKLPSNAIWKHFNGEGKTAHFYHATGFPLMLYSPLLNKLRQKFNLSAMALRGTWSDIGLPPRKRDYWRLYTDDLIKFIEQECKPPIIGIGHSIGATCTILAADRRPDLFSNLILVEPAMAPPNLSTLIRLTPKFLMKFTEPAKSTLKKQDTWASREEFLDFCRHSKAYKRFPEEAFQLMSHHSIVETNEGHFKLAYSKIWEADVYMQAPTVLRHLERIKIPCLAIRGKPSVFFSEDLWKKWKKICPETVFKENLEYGHLFPLENPLACYKLIENES